MKRSVCAAISTAVLATAMWAVPLPASAGPSIGSLAGAGERPGATRLKFTAGDSVRAQVDVGSGNLLVTVRGLALPDVDRQVQVGAFYNSAASDKSPVPRLGRGWGLDYTPDVRVVQNSDGSITYYASGGRVGVFDLASGSTTSYVSPGGFKMSLVKTSSGWTLTQHESQDELRFNTAGDLVSITDRNDNVTTMSQSGTAAFKNIAIRTPAGGTDARAANVSTATANGTTTTTVFQGASTSLRQISFEKVYDNATRFIDARGRSTTFSYTNNGLLTQIAAPGGVTTQFGYDSSRRVSSITQKETATGGPGDSITRLAYPSSTQTLLADPNTDQSQPITSVPRTTYTLNSSQRVTKTVDAAGRERSETYTANFDTASATAGTGTTASTQTNTWGANNGQSLTKTQSGEGSAQSLSYANTSGAAQYNPTGGTDDAGNASTYTYNGSGNQLSSTNANSAQAKVSYNADGTASSATSPGNGSNSTKYTYTNKQTTGLTPVTGSSLGSRAYTYDSLGRLKTTTNGRGITTTYSYNENDQVTSIGYTGGAVLTYEYDAAGRNNRRAENSGTTTYDYDQLGRLTGRQNSAGGGKVSYTYDKASRMTSSTSQVGQTTKYSYDASGVPTVIEYPRPQNNDTSFLRFTTDDQGRRTGTYLQANATLSSYVGRSLNTYDKSGRVTRVLAETRANNTNTPVVDLTYCYKAGSTPAGGCTGGTTTDRDKLVWKKDNLTGKSTRYTYDGAGRMTKAAASDGTNYDYGFSSAGNRTSANSQALSFNAANQITTSGYAYDGAGNLTADAASGSSGITYTPADQVNSLVKSGTTYTYKHAGNDNNELLEQTSPDGTYRYTYGREAQSGVPVVEQIHKTSGSSTSVASVISDPVTGSPLMLRSNTGMQTMYVFDGTPGAPIALLTSAAQQAFGYDYDPYGVPVVTQDSGGNGIPQNPYTFGGAGVRDRTTDWVHYGTRYYSTRTGTFTQQDTLDAPLDPTNANRYAYAAGDPTNNVDPTGRSCAGAIAVGALSGAGYVASTVSLFTTPLTGVGGVAAAAGYQISSAGFALSGAQIAKDC